MAKTRWKQELLSRVKM